MKTSWREGCRNERPLPSKDLACLPSLTLADHIPNISDSVSSSHSVDNAEGTLFSDWYQRAVRRIKSWWLHLGHIAERKKNESEGDSVGFWGHNEFSMYRFFTTKTWKVLLSRSIPVSFHYSSNCGRLWSAINLQMKHNTFWKEWTQRDYPRDVRSCIRHFLLTWLSLKWISSFSFDHFPAFFLSKQKFTGIQQAKRCLVPKVRNYHVTGYLDYFHCAVVFSFLFIVN